MEPLQNRDMGSLAPLFLYPFREWFRAAQSLVPHVELRISEARRTAERQAWLYKQGREAPFLARPQVTWERESLHQWGLGVDWFMVRPSGEAVWAGDSYRYVYKVCPPEDFGLRTFATDLVHLEHYFADAAVKQAAALGLYRA